MRDVGPGPLGVGNFSHVEQLLLLLSNHLVQIRRKLGKDRLDVLEEHLGALLYEVRGSELVDDVTVGRVHGEVLLLRCAGTGNALSLIDVSLGAVDHSNVTEGKGRKVGVLTGEDSPGISATVHEVKLSENTKGALSLRVNLTGDLNGVRVGKIRVGSSNGKDKTVGFGGVRHDHVANLLANVLGLIPNSNLGRPRQINEGEVEDIRGVNP
mmetsp:Transcript_17214/g.35448  ORF Transcript_17214/g.35448 Transcript_17214/m.35448 type:complete len:211 (+) Transcript_17214:1459-2091(+)